MGVKDFFWKFPLHLEEVDDFIFFVPRVLRDLRLMITNRLYKRKEIIIIFAPLVKATMFYDHLQR